MAHKEFLTQVSRRDVVRGFVGLTGLAALGLLDVACAPITPRKKLEEMTPNNEGERQIYDTLKTYQRIKAVAGSNEIQSAIITEAALTAKDDIVAVTNFNFFRNIPNTTADEAAVLTVTAQINDAGKDQVAATFDKAKKAVEIKKEQALNVTSIATFTMRDVDSVARYYSDVDKSQSQKQLVPIMVTAGFGNVDKANAVVREVYDNEGITNPQSVTSILYAATFTEATLEDIIKIHDELEGLGMTDNARADLLVAAAFNDLNLESIIEMYNFAGTLEGMSQEVAAKLVLATIARNLAIPEFQDKLRLENNGGGTRVVYTGGGGHYFLLASSHNYPRTSTGFSSVRSPSFSKPGTAPVRGTGGTYGGRAGTPGGSTTGGSRGGGIGGRGGSGGG